MSQTRRWRVDNIEDQIRNANRDLRSKLIQTISRRKNLNSQLPDGGDGSSILEIVGVLINNRIISMEGRSREFAELITRMGDRVDRGERISPEEFRNGDYTTAIGWFDGILAEIEDESIDQI
jgi:hypothetical protein